MKVVVDTSTIVHLLATTGADTAAKHARQHVSKIILEGGAILVPSVVVAELWYEGTKGSKHLEAFGALASGSLRVPAFTQSAADIAGEMRAAGLKKHREEKREPRGAITYDALIAAIAVQQKASVLLTANPRDYAALFKSVGAAVEIRDSKQPPKGQTELFEGEGREKPRRKK